jgi:predicted secreted hydrolase
MDENRSNTTILYIVVIVVMKRKIEANNLGTAGVQGFDPFPQRDGYWTPRSESRLA